MNIIIAFSGKTFIKNKYEQLAKELKANLILLGNKVIIIKYPYDFKNKNEWYKNIFALRLMKIVNTSILITLNEPSCYLLHSKHIVWLHEDLKYLDFKLLKESRNIFCGNKKIYDKLRQNGFQNNLLIQKIPKTRNQWSELIKKIKYL